MSADHTSAIDEHNLRDWYVNQWRLEVRPDGDGFSVHDMDTQADETKIDHPAFTSREQAMRWAHERASSTPATTFFEITLGQRSGFAYASTVDVRKAIGSELWRWRMLPRFDSTSKRMAIADAVLSDAAWLGRRRGELATAVARDVREAAMDGCWTAPPDAAAAPGFRLAVRS